MTLPKQSTQFKTIKQETLGMREHKCECEFCPIYHGATIETGEFHDWIAKVKPHIWSELINDFMIAKLLRKEKHLGGVE